jgi:hypothetical protein
LLTVLTCYHHCLENLFFSYIYVFTFSRFQPLYVNRTLYPVLWNRNYFLRFRFRLLKSYGSGSGPTFEKVMIPVPVPTFEKLRFRFWFRFQLHIKSKFFFKNLFPFYIVSCFTRKMIININKFIVKYERKKR